MRSRVMSGAVAGEASIASAAARKPPMPVAITITATAPKPRNRMVWNVFTQAVPRMPPKNT
jgi:hypothetical protein